MRAGLFAPTKGPVPGQKEYLAYRWHMRFFLDGNDTPPLVLPVVYRRAAPTEAANATSKATRQTLAYRRERDIAKEAIGFATWQWRRT